MITDEDSCSALEAPKDVLEQRARLSLLLDVRSQLDLRDVCLRLFSSTTVPSNSDQARQHATRALGRLRHALQTPSAALGQNVQAMADACHGAWVLSSALCAAAESSVLSTSADAGLPLTTEVGRRPIDEAAFLISALCLEGPSALRPALLPCIALLIQGRGHLLSLHPSLLESIRCGLSSSSRVLRMRALDTMAAILTDASGEHGIATILRHVAPLQHELISFVAAEVPPSMTTAALAATEVLVAAMKLSPRLALPHVVAECLAGAPCNAKSAQRMLLQLIGVEPQSLPDCLLDGVRRGAELWACRGVGPGELLGFGEPLGTLPANLRDHISEDVRCKCASQLLTALVGMRGLENGEPCKNLSVLGALLFRHLSDFAIDRHSIVQISSDSGLNKWQIESDHEPPLGTCVACLVLAALSESMCEAAALDSSSLCNLAAALEELDADEALAPGRRAALLALCSRELCAKSDPQLIEAQSCPRALPQHQCQTGTKAESEPEMQQAPNPLPSGTMAGTSDEFRKPWFAEYDASCDKWRCILCAQAGGQNPYAKGIAIKSGLVPVRMRMHARSQVHKQAEERKRKAASTDDSDWPEQLAAAAGSSEGAIKRSRPRWQKLSEPSLKEATERHASLGGA